MAGSELYTVFKDVAVAANGSRTINVVGVYASVLKANLDFNIGFNDDAVQFITQGLTIGTRDGSTFKSVRIENPNGAALTVTLAFGVGQIRDARLSTSAPIDLTKAASIATTADVACANAAVTVVKAANTLRRSIEVQNLDPVAVLRVGDASVTAARGLRLGPGESVTLPTTAAVSVRNDSGASVKVAVLEVVD